MTRRPAPGYLTARMAELHRPETRASGVALGQWAEKRIRLEGKPFSFKGTPTYEPSTTTPLLTWSS